MGILLTKQNIVGSSGVHRFRMDSDNAIVEAKVTVAAYRDGVKKGTALPALANARWIASFTTPAFDTPSQELDDNQYAVYNNMYVFVKIKANRMAKIPAAFVQNDLLTDAGIIEVDKWR